MGSLAQAERLSNTYRLTAKGRREFTITNDGGHAGEDEEGRPESVVIKSGLDGVAFHKFVRYELYNDNLVPLPETGSRFTVALSFYPFRSNPLSRASPCLFLLVLLSPIASVKLFRDRPTLLRRY